VKNYSAALKTFVAKTPAHNRADLFVITCGTPQNLLVQSQALQNTTSWGGGGSSGAPTVTGNATAAPDGTLTATQVAFPSTGPSQESFLEQFSGVVPVARLPYTFSVWLKAASPVTAHLQIVQSTGENNTIVPVAVTTTWTRFSMTLTPATVGTGQLIVRLEQPGSSSAITIFAWAAQLEVAATMGIYLATQAATSGNPGPRRAIYATSSQVDITIQGVTFYSTQYGAWQRGKVTSEASFELHSNSMSLTVMAPTTIPFLGTSLNYMSAALAGLFDAAHVEVYTAYWPLNAPPNPYLVPNPFVGNVLGAPLGLEYKFIGYILPDGQIGRSKIEFTVADPLLQMNLKTPPNVIQASCRKTLYDPNCTLNAASYSSANSVASGSTTQSIVTGSTLPNSVPYYSQGFITFTSGQNAGLTYSIKSQLSTSNFLLASKTLLPLTIGDTFLIYAGCDKTADTCKSRFNNLIHFGGQPFVPNPEVAI
jgi:uncharacterized protein